MTKEQEQEIFANAQAFRMLLKYELMIDYQSHCKVRVWRSNPSVSATVFWGGEGVGIESGTRDAIVQAMEELQYKNKLDMKCEI